MANAHDRACRESSAVQTEAGAADTSGAFDLFFRQQYAPLVQFLREHRRMGDEAEDLAQESLTRFLSYVDRQPRAAWKPFLYRIAINVVNDRLRRRRVRQALSQASPECLGIVADAPGADEVAAHLQQQSQLHAAIRALPPQCRQVYLLKLLRGMTNVQIAERCGISSRMVEKHLANALVQLHRRFGSLRADT